MQRFGSSLWLTGALALALVFVVHEVAMSERSARPEILLSCPDQLSGEAALAGPICRAMTEALAAAAPDRVIHPVARGAERPQRSGDLGVALHVGHVTRFGLTGYLEWWHGSGETPRRMRGPTVEFDVMDTEISPSMFPEFTRGLIRATPALLAQ